MVSKRVGIVGLVVVLVVGGGAAFLTRDLRHWSDGQFESCTIVGRGLVLDYSYGAGDGIRTSFEKSEGVTRVRLEVASDDGPHAAVALYGQMRLDDWGSGDDPEVLQHDGSRLTCTPAPEPAALP